jgi:hypothetical protein
MLVCITRHVVAWMLPNACRGGGNRFSSMYMKDRKVLQSTSIYPFSLVRFVSVRIEQGLDAVLHIVCRTP